MSFFTELKRRNVIRVSIAYVVVGWLVSQVAEFAIETFGAPDWVLKIFVVFLMLGFPIVAIFAWAFEMTPEGIRRERDVDRKQSIVKHTGRKLDYTIIFVMALALGYFIYDKVENQAGDGPVTIAEVNVQEAPPVTADTVPVDPSIAVLPFTDMSPDQDQGYFSDGISEELLNVLVKVDGLKVASRTSSFTYKGSTLSLAEIAGELKVDHVLEGSVRKAENRVRITAQLIDANTDRHIWSDTFDRELVDIFAIQDEIANAIVDALRAELGVLADSGTISVKADTENLDAYELYLKARAMFMARDRLEECIALFERAVELDPEFARAWEGLAAVYSIAESWDILDRDYTNMSMGAAKTALDINPDLSMPYAVLGSKTNDIDHDVIKSIEYLDRAIAVDPTNATAYLWRSIIRATLGFFDKAINDTNSCLELDPMYENCRRHLARYHLIAGNSDLALELFKVSAERGFFGSNEPFAHELIKRGDRLAAALGIWQWRLDDRSYPAEIFLDALEFPDRDHSQSLKKFLHWVKNKDAKNDPASWPSELLALGGFEYVRPDDFNNSWIWQEENERFRKSEYFKPMVRELGLPVYWREKGFPPRCRPLGEGDFACD